MKRFLKTTISLVLIGFVIYEFYPQIGKNILPVWERIVSQILRKNPCLDPIPYNLGTFDSRFNISENYFLSAIADAEAVWEKPTGTNLFSYEPKASSAGLWSRSISSDVLKINLIYDYRQEATSKLAGLGIVVQNTKASYNELKAKFEALKVKYNETKSVFDAQLEIFNQKQQAYMNEVNLWNKKGGAPAEQYSKLEQDRLKLEAESKNLQSMQKIINNTVDEINALVVVLNRLVSSLNLSVEKYNTINTSRGESFEEGVYMSDGRNREIDVYEFSNREKLVRVLAHEFGHALNLDHVKDPKAIMYELNQSDNNVPTPADLEEFKIKCGKN